jgi:hypothetical protein
MAVVRTSNYDGTQSVTFNTADEAEKLSAYLKEQLVGHPFLEDIENNNERVLYSMYHGGIGVVQFGDDEREFVVSALNLFGTIPDDLTVVL